MKFELRHSDFIRYSSFVIRHSPSDFVRHSSFVLRPSESEVPLAASRYRLCWCSCLTLVLLRVAVGWHFLHEGLWKIDSHRQQLVSVPAGHPSESGWKVDSHREVPKPFSAEGYLANSSGPLRDWFRSKLDDPDGIKRLEPASIVKQWEDTLRDFTVKYNLSGVQQASARAKLQKLQLAKEEYFGNAENKKKVSEYLDAMEKVLKDENSPLSFERERAKEQRRELAKTRDEIAAPISTWDRSLRDHVTGELTPDQIAAASKERLGGIAGALGLPFTLDWPERDLDQINLVTMCGLTLAGGLMVIGLFSRISALAAAALVGMFYACNPAPPLGAGMPGDPGHYFIVNKELIECVAALVLATIPTGRWLGVDALIRGLVTRRLSAIFMGTPDDAIVKM